MLFAGRFAAAARAEDGGSLVEGFGDGGEKGSAAGFDGQRFHESLGLRDIAWGADGGGDFPKQAALENGGEQTIDFHVGNELALSDAGEDGRRGECAAGGEGKVDCDLFGQRLIELSVGLGELEGEIGCLGAVLIGAAAVRGGTPSLDGLGAELKLGSDVVVTACESGESQEPERRGFLDDGVLGTEDFVDMLDALFVVAGLVGFHGGKPIVGGGSGFRRHWARGAGSEQQREDRDDRADMLNAHGGAFRGEVGFQRRNDSTAGLEVRAC